MAIDLDPATEQRLQQELVLGPYREPSELIAHALDLIQSEREDLTGRRAEILAELDESLAQVRRGEGVSSQWLEADFERRKLAYEGSLIAQTEIAPA